MSAAYWSGQVVAGLVQVLEPNRHRRRALDAVARGEATMTADQRASLKHSEKRIDALLEEISDGTIRRARVVTEAEVNEEREHLPRPLREAYEQLYITAYGSDPAVSVGDANVIRGVGKRETRVTTTREVRAPGAPSATKKFGQGNRNVIKSRKAYETKVKIDRRLRRLAKEIEEFLHGEERSFTVTVCSHCNRIGEDDWKFCPNCGGHMKVEERE